jgi:hypothetical protein
MSEPHVISALRTKRAETAGEIIRRQHELDQLRADLMHIDSVLRLLDPDIIPGEIMPRMKVRHRSEYFGRGELSRRVFEAIRNHGDVTPEDLAATAMRDKGLALMDHVMRRYFVNRFAMACLHLTRRGKLVKVGQGRNTRWRIAEREPGLL